MVTLVTAGPSRERIRVPPAAARGEKETVNCTARELLGLVLLTVVAAACSRASPDTTESPGSRPSAVAETASSAPTLDTPPPAPAEPTVRADVPDEIEGAKVSMDSTTVDGLAMEKIQCKGGSGIFGGVALLGALAKQKSAFTECSDSPQTVRVHVAFDGNTTSDVRVAGASSPKVAGCVAAAVSAAKFGATGACVLSLKVGKR